MSAERPARDPADGPPLPPDKPKPAPAVRLARIAFTLALGAAGGWVAERLALPLPWMVGALIVVTAASMAGLPVAMSPLIRQPMTAIIGVLLGAAFTPAVLARLDDWIAPILAMALYVVALTPLLTVYFRRVGGFDPRTAYFAAAPGGLNEMTLMGEAMGADPRRVVLVHAARIFMVVLVIPFGFAFAGLYDTGQRPSAGGPLLSLSAREIGLLAGSAVVGYGLGRLLRLPAPLVLGPMLVSAAVHLLGWSDSKPPDLLVNVAQCVIGSAIGTRFAGTAVRTVLAILALALGSTLVMIALGFGFAFALKPMTDASVPALILAFAPGGLTEMSLVALAMAIDTAFIATLHVVRIVFVIVLVPAMFRWRNNPQAKGPPD